MSNPWTFSRCAAVAAVFLLAAVEAPAQGLKVAAHKEPVPSDFEDEVKARFADGGQRVTIGSVTLDFWWVKALPLAAAGSDGQAATWAAVAEGELVGAVKISGEYPDLRGRVISPGVFTLRYGIQPQDGDHLGVSPFQEFLLISPADIDTEAAATGHDDTVDLSTNASGISHPAILSIDPPVAKDALLTLRKTELGHTAVVFEVPAARDGKPAGSLRFGLVLIGRIEV